MELKDFKEYILKFPKGKIFNYGISEPFSWRGSYDEVAFAITESPMTREDILTNIEFAYSEIFYGYKGGEYTYKDWTKINFEEEGSRNYSDGDYTAKLISKIENSEVFKSQEERLIKLAFE